MTKNIELKGSSFTLSVLQLKTLDLDEIQIFLEEKCAQAPAFFEHAPLVIDIEELDPSDFDFSGLKMRIAQAGFIPVGISGIKDAEIQKTVKNAGFAVMSKSKAPKKPEKEKPQQETTTHKVVTAVVEQPPRPAKIVTVPVRSGQQIYAKDSDLIILNHVSHGAEVIADGNIHIYGTLHGRAIAGASCQLDAQIFCQNLQAELVSINGDYWLDDNIPEQFKKKNARIWRQDEQLMISILDK